MPATVPKIAPAGAILWEHQALRALLPDFVQRHRSLGTFWPFIRDRYPTYAERRAYIAEALLPVARPPRGATPRLDDSRSTETIRSFDPEGVHEVWVKALSRWDSDPDDAVTSARTLLETVIKRILAERKIERAALRAR